MTKYFLDTNFVLLASTPIGVCNAEYIGNIQLVNFCVQSSCGEYEG